jgi:bifunctional DNA-binding transcriptional regulator/antitoxin component of YhaV-PrlF toxin-antitoxin module
MTTFRLSVKEKGRTVLPAGLQRACGFAPGAELVARPLGQGRFLVESTDAVLSRIWERAADGATVEGVADLSMWRADADAQRWEQLEAAELPPEDVSRERAADLLAELGL